VAVGLKLHNPRNDDHTDYFLIVILFLALLVLVGLMEQKAKAADLAEGDSIALGTGRALGVPTHARQNMGSCWIVAHTPGGSFDHVVLSAGINDPPGPCLASLRARLTAKVVVWVLPAPINSARASVAAVAARWGDRTVSYACAGGCTRRNFHPASYAVVANAVRRAWGVK
jgi:hypothetical protein